MQRTFLSNLVFLLFLNLLVKPFWIFGIDRVVQNEVGAETYGSYFALFNFALILNIFLDLGISNFNNRNISQHQQVLGKYFPRMVMLRILLAIGYFGLCLASALILDYSENQLRMLGVLCLNQFLLSSILFLRSNIAGLQLFRTDSMISVLDRLLMILGCGVMLWGINRTEPFRIEWFIWMQTAAYSITLLTSLAIVLTRGRGFILVWNPQMLIIILKKSLPFALLILLMSIYGRVDSVILERMLPDGKQQTGIYAQAFRLLDASNMIAYLFAVLLLPMFARMLKLGQDVWPLTKLASKLILIPTFTLGIICFFHGEPLMKLLYTSHVEESSQVLSILMFSLFPMAGAYVFGTLLTSNGNLKYLNFIALLSVLSSVILNIFLIPYYGVVGAAFICLGTQTMAFLLQIVVSIKVFEFRLWRPVMQLTGCLLAIAATAFFTVRLGEWLGMIVTSICAVMMMAILLVPDLKLARKLLKTLN